MVKIFSYLGIGSLVFISTIEAAVPQPANNNNQQKVSPPPAQEAIVPLNQIVAVVNEEIITQTDLNQSIEELKQQILYTHAAMPSEQQLRDEALQQLINYRLQLQMAARNNVRPTDEELNNAIEQIAKSHNLTVDQMKEQLKLQNTTYEDFRKKISDQLIVSKIQQIMVAGKVHVTDQDIQEYKNKMTHEKEYQLADFFLPLPEQPTSQLQQAALTAAQEIQQKLNQGVNIDSIRPPYRDLGWRSTQDLPQLFANQLPHLTLQNSSPPLLAPNGYHVLKLVGERDKNPLTEEQIRNLVFQDKYQAAVKEAVDKARKQAYIQIMPQ